MAIAHCTHYFPSHFLCFRANTNAHGRQIIQNNNKPVANQTKTIELNWISSILMAMEAAPANQHNISNPLFPYAHPLLKLQTDQKSQTSGIHATHGTCKAYTYTRNQHLQNHTNVTVCFNARIVWLLLAVNAFCTFHARVTVTFACTWVIVREAYDGVSVALWWLAF